MGLAASQARFLGITLRKANCEFKSSELAQQKLELTNQMTDISQEYSNALNATKLVWHNDMVCDSFGNPTDFGLTYSLLMTPSPANDYNPYMISTRSGAIVLNAKFADAAEYAGISMAGGIPSQAGRDKFIAALANIDGAKPANQRAKGDKNNNVITETTYNKLTQGTSDVVWHSTAGMGAVPKDKSIAAATTIEDLIYDHDIGQRSVDWLQIGRGLLGFEFSKAITEVQSEDNMQGYVDNIAYAKLAYLSNDLEGLTLTSTGANITSAGLNTMVTDATTKAGAIIDKFKTITSADQLEEYRKFCVGENSSFGQLDDTSDPMTLQIAYMSYLDAKIEFASNTAERLQYTQELEDYKKGYGVDGKVVGATYNTANGVEELNKSTAQALYENGIYWSVYEKVKTEKFAETNKVNWGTGANEVNISELFQTADSSIAGGIYTLGSDKINKLTIVDNNVIVHSESDIKGMTIADLLTRDITIITKGDPHSDEATPVNSIARAGEYLLDYIASVFGYGHIGTGLNIDTTSDRALTMAYNMVKKKMLNEGNVVFMGSEASDSSMLSNSAYKNSHDYNRIGATYSGDYAALNLSNMVSAFLTYYDNLLSGSQSQYIVGRGNTDGKTLFVTDDPGYVYVTNTPEEVSNDEKIADFYNQLYNNICEHGWRYDDMVIDHEYLESSVKDGRYQIMALNGDGYFYQQRYNDLSYMEEVRDEDAISRAEVNFTTKKAQITYKEDQIDIKNKKLDAEITELNTEINSVQNIISKTIEKTFSLFSN